VGWFVGGDDGERGEWEGKQDEGDKCHGARAVFVGYVAFETIKIGCFSCIWEDGEIRGWGRGRVTEERLEEGC
jgi:hypothetical protein